MDAVEKFNQQAKNLRNKRWELTDAIEMKILDMAEYVTVTNRVLVASERNTFMNMAIELVELENELCSVKHQLEEIGEDTD